MKIVLVSPQIPQNTGNIVRTCAVTGSELFLVRPLGFSVNDRWLKRAGLDYWEGVKVQIVDSLEEILNQSSSSFYFFSSKANCNFVDIRYKSDDFLIFGSETDGLPSFCLNNWPEQFAKIPMIPEVRCLNLATSVGIVVYEAWRQLNFVGFKPNLSPKS